MKTKKSKTNLFICLFACFPGFTQMAGGQVMDSVLTLDDCIGMSYANNFKLKQLSMETEKEKLRFKEMKSTGLPQISASVSVEDYFDIPVTMVSGDIFGQPGATLPIQLGTKFNSGAGIQFGQMLYNASYFTSLKLFKKSCEISELNYLKGKEEMAYNVSKIYSFIQLSELQLALLDSNIVAFANVLIYSEQHFLNGFISNSDLSRVKVAINNLEAEKENMMTMFDQQVNMLKYLAGIEPNQPVKLTDLTDAREITPVLIDSALSSHIDILLLDRQREQAELNLKLIRSGNVPSVTAYAGYSYQAQREAFDLFSDADIWYRTSFAGIKLTIPICEGGKDRHRAKLARTEVDQGVIAREDLKSELYMNFLNTSAKLNSGRLIESKMKDNMILTENIFKVINEQYGQGLKSLTDVLNAQAECNTSRISWLQALLQVKLSELELVKINGGFLNK